MLRAVLQVQIGLSSTEHLKTFQTDGNVDVFCENKLWLWVVFLLLILLLMCGEFITVTYQISANAVLKAFGNILHTCFQEGVHLNRCVEYMSNYILITKLQQSADGFRDLAWPQCWNKMQTQFMLDYGNQWLLKDAGVNNHAVFKGRWVHDYWAILEMCTNQIINILSQFPQKSTLNVSRFSLVWIVNITLIFISLVTLIKRIRYGRMNSKAIFRSLLGDSINIYFSLIENQQEPDV